MHRSQRAWFKLLQLALVCCFLLHGCARRLPLVEDASARKSPLSNKNLIYSSFSISEVVTGDYLPKESLIASVKQSLAYYTKIPAKTSFYYGKVKYRAREIAASMRIFLRALENYQSQEQFVRVLEENFHLFASAANDNRGVLFTGYYEPIYQGSLKRTRVFRYPAYRVPPDLKVLDLSDFRDSLKNRTLVYRLDKNKTPVPYFNRKEIMSQHALRGKKLELVWFRDPLDLFFLQVQGSGIVVTPEGKRVKLSYAGANGRPYSSIGKYLLDAGKMTLDEISMGSIRHYLNQHRAIKNKVLYHNESYTFFNMHEEKGGPRGVINVPLTPLRSVAVDVNIFPRGALTYIRTSVPTFDGDWKKAGESPLAGFALAQDTGGVIRGPGRVDLFWGNGELAENSAGAMRSFRQLFFLIAKKEVIYKELNSLVSK